MRKESRVITFGPTVTYGIESLDGCTNKPNNAKNKDYRHTERIRNLDPVVELKRAHLRAVLWHESVVLDSPETIDESESSEVFNQRVLRVMTPELKVAASASRANGSKRWLVDTGCPLDLIAEYEIGQDEKEYIKPATDSVRLNTANGITKANRIIKYRVDGMEDGIEAFVLSSTPTVMSVGKRCMERGYDFIWKAGEKPYLVPPSGRRMMLDVISNVPYLPVCSSTACAVASIGQPEQTCFGSDSCYSIDDLSIDWGSDVDCSPAASDGLPLMMRQGQTIGLFEI
jgi:hypothetical protein